MEIKIVREYCRKVYKQLGPVVYGSVSGYLVVYHEHWRYVYWWEAPVVYLGGKSKTKPTYIWLE